MSNNIRITTKLMTNGREVASVSTTVNPNSGGQITQEVGGSTLVTSFVPVATGTTRGKAAASNGGRRGRPPGSKNRPKVDVPDATLGEAVVVSKTGPGEVPALPPTAEVEVEPLPKKAATKRTAAKRRKTAKA